MAERLEEKPSGEERAKSTRSETQKTSDPRLHYVELDALRGIAILGVVMLHATTPWDRLIGVPLSVPLLDLDLMPLFGLGGLGVTLFFLLSGYLLAWTEGKRASKGNYSLRSYALRRILRLVPAYYTALVLILLVWPVDPTLWDTLLHFAFLQSFVPFLSSYDPAYWSLTPEVVFYALLPLLVLKLRGPYQRLALLGALLVMSVMVEAGSHAIFQIVPGTSLSRLQHFPLNSLWVFVVGVLLRMLVERLDEKGSGRSRPAVAFLLFVVSLTLLALCPYVSFLQGWAYLRKFLMIGFFAAALLGSPVLSWVLARRPLGFIGEISYSLFLLHGSVLLIAKFFVLSWLEAHPALLNGVGVWLAFVGYIGSVLVVAGALSYLSYRYIESPFLRIKPK